MKEDSVMNKKDPKMEYEDLVKQKEELEKRNMELSCLNDELSNRFFYINVPIIIVDADLRILQLTSKAGEIFHMGPTAIGKPVTDFRKYLNIPNLEDLILDVMKKGSMSEQKVQDQDGHWYSLRFTPCKGINNKIEGLMIVIIDIDSLLNAKQILDYEMSNLIHILDYMEDGVYIVNQNFEIEYINPILKREFGSPEGRKCFEYFHNRKTMCPWCKNREVLSGKTVRWEWYSPKTDKIYELIDAPLKNPDESISKIVILSNITDRKKAEEALQENENKFRQFIESMHEGIWVIDQNDVTTFVNPRMANLLGYTMDELLGKSLFSFIEECDIKRCRNGLDCCRNGTSKTKDFEFLRKDGTKIYTRIEFSQSTDSNGNYIGAVAYITDITDLKKADRAAKDSEAKFLALAENSPSMIFINRMGKVIYVNKRVEEIVGFKREEFYSPCFDFFTVIAPESREMMRQKFNMLMEGEKTHPLQSTFITKKDKRIDALLTANLIYDDGEKATLGIITDFKITE